MLHNELTEKIIHAFYYVNNTLGHGFLEKVYENAMVIELKRMDLEVEKKETLKSSFEVKKSVTILQICSSMKK